MRRSTATREEHHGFPLAGFLPGYFRLLLFLRWTSYKCPHCGDVFRRDFWPGNVRLGQGERTCRKCGAVFDDGSREWQQLGMSGKLRFFFPPLLIGVSGGFLLAGILVSILPQRDWRVTIAALILAAVPIFLWSLIRWPWVVRSIRRYNSRGKSAIA